MFLGDKITVNVAMTLNLEKDTHSFEVISTSTTVFFILIFFFIETKYLLYLRSSLHHLLTIKLFQLHSNFFNKYRDKPLDECLKSKKFINYWEYKLGLPADNKKVFATSLAKFVCSLLVWGEFGNHGNSLCNHGN